jgi:Protein of unknown function (DUF2786)
VLGDSPPGPPDFGEADPEDVTVSQTAELSRVNARIKALTEKTIANGCTKAEAMAAAEMVGRLLERYALSRDTIEIRTARCVQVAAPLGGRRRRPIDGCVLAIARFCDCKVWLARAASLDPMVSARPDATIAELKTWLLATHKVSVSNGQMWARLETLDLRLI